MRRSVLVVVFVWLQAAAVPCSAQISQTEDEEANEQVSRKAAETALAGGQPAVALELFLRVEREPVERGSLNRKKAAWLSVGAEAALQDNQLELAQKLAGRAIAQQRLDFEEERKSEAKLRDEQSERSRINFERYGHPGAAALEAYILNELESRWAQEDLDEKRRSKAEAKLLSLAARVEVSLAVRHRRRRAAFIWGLAGLGPAAVGFILLHRWRFRRRSRSLPS